MTNLPPAAWQCASATVNGFTANYTVPTNATLAAVAAGLANALNLQSNLTQVIAFPVGDRIELQSLAVTNPGSNVTVSTSAGIGSASKSDHKTDRRAIRHFLDSVAMGYQLVTISNAPNVGDWLQFTFIKTNGTIVTRGRDQHHVRHDHRDAGAESGKPDQFHAGAAIR